MNPIKQFKKFIASIKKSYADAYELMRALNAYANEDEKLGKYIKHQQNITMRPFKKYEEVAKLKDEIYSDITRPTNQDRDYTAEFFGFINRDKDSTD